MPNDVDRAGLLHTFTLSGVGVFTGDEQEGLVDLQPSSASESSDDCNGESRFG